MSVMSWIWLVLLILFIVTEVATAQLTTIWFAAGALVSLILSLAGIENIPAQVIVFVLVSLISLIATRPLVKKLTQKTKQATNADMCIGQQAVVISDIDNLKSTGQVKINGNIWSARSIDGRIIPSNTTVTVRSIEGVKLIVE